MQHHVARPAFQRQMPPVSAHRKKLDHQNRWSPTTWQRSQKSTEELTDSLVNYDLMEAEISRRKHNGEINVEENGGV